MKKNTLYDIIKTRAVEGNIIADQEILLSSDKGQECPRHATKDTFCAEGRQRNYIDYQ
jgi:hypothetical protein